MQATTAPTARLDAQSADRIDVGKCRVFPNNPLKDIVFAQLAIDVIR